MLRINCEQNQPKTIGFLVAHLLNCKRRHRSVLIPPALPKGYQAYRESQTITEMHGDEGDWQEKEIFPSFFYGYSKGSQDGGEEVRPEYAR